MAETDQHSLVSNEQRKLINSKRIPMDVTPYEFEMITEIRKFKHGRFIVQMLDGIPTRYITETSQMFFESKGSDDMISKAINGGGGEST